jgi:hypothetical protein
LNSIVFNLECKCMTSLRYTHDKFR